ncbi:MAG: hypothetical protein AVDCRST_MAG71-98, partial [uncultured Lysobacter sp.]
TAQRLHSVSTAHSSTATCAIAG